jgi:hypothetical protein
VGGVGDVGEVIKDSEGQLNLAKIGAGEADVTAEAAVAGAEGATAAVAEGAAADSASLLSIASESLSKVAGPAMLVYMFASAVCSKVKPDEKWCDPIGEVINLDMQSCSNFNVGNSPTMPGNPNINPSQLLRPDCAIIDTVDLAYKYVIKNIPAAIGYIIEGFCNIGGDSQKCTGLESKVAEGIGKGVEFVGQVFSSSFSTVISVFSLSLADNKPILYPWEESGSINSGNAVASAAIITGLAVAAMYIGGPVGVIAVAAFDTVRRIINIVRSHGCGSTGDTSPNPNSSCKYRTDWLCCEADGPAHNDNCSGVYQKGGLYRAC